MVEALLILVYSLSSYDPDDTVLPSNGFPVPFKVRR